MEDVQADVQADDRADARAGDSIADCLAFLLKNQSSGALFSLSESVGTVTPHGGEPREFPLKVLTFALLQRNDQLSKERACAENEFNLSMLDRAALKRKNAQLSKKLRTIFDVSRSEFAEPSDDEAPDQEDEQSAEEANEEGEEDGPRAKKSGTRSSLPQVKRAKTNERKRQFGYLHPNAALLQNLLDFCDGRKEDVLFVLAAQITNLNKTQPLPRSIKRFPTTYQKAWNKFQRSRALYQEFLEDKYPEKILQAKPRKAKTSGADLVDEEEEEEEDGGEELEEKDQEPADEGVAQGQGKAQAEPQSSSDSGSSDSDSSDSE